MPSARPAAPKVSARAPPGPRSSRMRGPNATPTCRPTPAEWRPLAASNEALALHPYLAHLVEPLPGFAQLGEDLERSLAFFSQAGQLAHELASIGVDDEGNGTALGRVRCRPHKVQDGFDPLQIGIGRVGGRNIDELAVVHGPRS